MSAPAAAARYIIAADDRTKGAIASAVSGFRKMESGIKGTVSRINIALGLVGGVALKRALQNVFVETAKQSKDFAYALDDVKRAAKNLLAAKEGAPAATAAMKELAQVLKDPDVVAAADAISSAFIRGAAGSIKFALGVKTLQDQIEELKQRRESLVSGAGDGASKPRKFIKGEPTANLDTAQEVYRINAEIAQKQAALTKQQADDAKKAAAEWQRILASSEEVTKRFEQMQRIRHLIADSEEQLKNLDEGSFGDSKFFEQLKREGDVSHALGLTNFFEEMDKAARDTGETLDWTRDHIDQVSDALGRTIGATQEWSAETDQAARNVESALADFIFDPFENGVRGMLKSFVDTLRRMAAEVAAQQIFKKAGGIEGLSNLFGSFFGGGTKASSGSSTSGYSGPRAGGGPVSAGSLYKVNENGLEFFRPNASGQVIPLSKMGGAGGGAGRTVNITTNINGPVTKEALPGLDAILRAHGKRIKGEMATELQSGRIPISK